MERYGIAIIGTGPAGLSAAVTATVRNKKVLLLGNKNLSDKVGKAHDIQNYLGLPDVSGENLAKAFQSHLDNLGIQFTLWGSIIPSSQPAAAMNPKPWFWPRE